MVLSTLEGKVGGIIFHYCYIGVIVKKKIAIRNEWYSKMINVLRLVEKYILVNNIHIISNIPSVFCKFILYILKCCLLLYHLIHIV